LFNQKYQNKYSTSCYPQCKLISLSVMGYDKVALSISAQKSDLLLPPSGWPFSVQIM